LGWEAANRAVLLGAEEGREPEDFGVPAERCSEDCLTMFALSMTGLSAMKDPKRTTRVKGLRIDVHQLPRQKWMYAQMCE
jgi:hypothetical protein